MVLRLGFPRTLAERGGVGDGAVSDPSSISVMPSIRARTGRAKGAGFTE
jgi:hypothetical protein